MQPTMLGKLQYYRNTMIIIGALLVVAIIIGIIAFNGPNSSQSPTAMQSYPLKRTPLPGTLVIDWEKIKLGQSKDQVFELTGEPESQEEKNGKLTLTYRTTSDTPLLKHYIVLKNDKVVRIVRSIVSYQENISKESFDKQYGKPEVLREVIDENHGSLYAYKVNNSTESVIEFSEYTQQILNIMVMTNEEYETYKKDEAPLKEQNLQHFGVPEF